MSHLATILNDQGRFPEAEKLNRQVLEVARRAFGPQDKLVRMATTNFAINLAYEGKYSDAGKAFQEVLEIDRRALGPDDPTVWAT